MEMLKDPECMAEIQQIVDECLNAKIEEIMVVTGLTEREVIGRLAGVA